MYAGTSSLYERWACEREKSTYYAQLIIIIYYIFCTVFHVGFPRLVRWTLCVCVCVCILYVINYYIKNLGRETRCTSTYSCTQLYSILRFDRTSRDPQSRIDKCDAVIPLTHHPFTWSDELRVPLIAVQTVYYYNMGTDRGERKSRSCIAFSDIKFSRTKQNKYYNILLVPHRAFH